MLHCAVSCISCSCACSKKHEGATRHIARLVRRNNALQATLQQYGDFARQLVTSDVQKSQKIQQLQDLAVQQEVTIVSLTADATCLEATCSEVLREHSGLIGTIGGLLLGGEDMEARWVLEAPWHNTAQHMLGVCMHSLFERLGSLFMDSFCCYH